MTTISNAEFLDHTEVGNISDGESLWSRIVCQIGSVFGRTWDYMNEEMGPVDASDVYYPM